MRRTDGSSPAARRAPASPLFCCPGSPSARSLSRPARLRSAPGGAAPGTRSPWAAQGRAPGPRRLPRDARAPDSSAAHLREPGAGSRRESGPARAAADYWMRPRSGRKRPSGMKRPLSPSPAGEKEPPVCEAAECPPRPPEAPKPKRERKRPSYTLCDVCNIQLNSAAQAQVHCGGRAHQRRLRQLSLEKTTPGPAGPASGAPSPLLASLALPARPLQPPLDFKHLLTFHFNGATPLSLFPNFSTMDPVQKAVISHTFGVPSPLKKKLFISCNICHLRFNSANQAEAHYKGHKHARKLKAVEAAKSKQRPQTLTQDEMLVPPTPTPASGAPEELHSKAVPAAPPPGPEIQSPRSPEPTPREPVPSDLFDAASSSSSSSCPPCSPEPGPEAPEPEPAAVAMGSGVSGEGRSEKGRLYCPTCKVTVNSASQLQAHNTGAKHRWMAEGQRGAPRRGRGRTVPRGGAGHKAKRVTGGRGGRQGPSPPFHCALCQLQVNSETQLKQHLSSRRHKDRLAGKPPKPSSQHSKLQKHAALAVSLLKSKLALQKQLTKTLAARFLPSPLPTAAAAICALPGPLALRPAPTAATTLFPAPILGPALFRTPAGAVRPATGPIVFAPY